MRVWAATGSMHRASNTSSVRAQCEHMRVWAATGSMHRAWNTSSVKEGRRPPTRVKWHDTK